MRGDQDRDDEDERTTQRSRGVIRDGRLTITSKPFGPFADRTANYASALRQAGTSIVQLEMDACEGRRELTVRFLPGSSETAEAVDALIEWALVAGCSRIWLPDRLIDLTGELIPDPTDLEVPSCPTCGVAAEENGPIEDVMRSRRRGLRPRTCPVCMTRLPERRSCLAD